MILYELKLKLICLLLLISLYPNDLFSQEPVKIMPLGGRITVGLDSETTYRSYLFELLKNAGHEIDFVGQLKGTDSTLTEPVNPEYDTDHEGHWGYTTEDLNREITKILEYNKPDILLIHVGTEQILKGGGTAHEVAERSISNLVRMIDSVRFVLPQMKFIVAKIIPMDVMGIPELDAAIEAQHEYLQIQKFKKSTFESPILLMDVHTGFSKIDDLGVGGMLPTKSGAEKMAQSMFEVVSNTLNSIGCMDSTYFEFDPSATISDMNLCQNEVPSWLPVSYPFSQNSISGRSEIRIFNLKGYRLRPSVGNFESNELNFRRFRTKGVYILQKTQSKASSLMIYTD